MASDRPSTRRLCWSPWTLVVLAAGLLLRLWVITTTRGMLIADESYTGLQAAAVLDGHFPVVIPGLVYTSPFDSYIFAPVTAVFGQNVFLLKLFPSLAWGAAAFMTVAIVRRLASDRAALIAGSLVWLAPGSLAVIATRAYESYATGMATAVATTLAVVLLLEAADAHEGGAPTMWRSALVGAIGGFGFYLHPMFIAVLLPVALVPCWRFRRCIRSWWLPSAGAALLANGPFLFWNSRHGWPSWSQPAVATDGPLDRLLRFATGLVPRAYGTRAQTGEYIFWRPLSIAILLALAVLAATGGVALFRRRRSTSLLVIGPLTIGWIMMAGFTNMSYVLDGRYAIITFPFVAIAVAVAADKLLPDIRGMIAATIGLWVAVLTVPFLIHETGTDFRDPNADFREVANLLESKGIYRLSGFYWWVLPVEFVSDQRIRSSVAGNPYVVLLPYTQRLVDSTPPEQVAFLFQAGDDDVAQLRMPIERYDRIVMGSIILYTPKP